MLLISVHSPLSVACKSMKGQMEEGMLCYQVCVFLFFLRLPADGMLYVGNTVALQSDAERRGERQRKGGREEGREGGMECRRYAPQS